MASSPDISFEVVKETPSNYSAAVTCRSARGTPPITFSLHDRTHLVANATSEERTTTFKVRLILGVDMGSLQCQANNGHQTTYSRWIPLEFGMNAAPPLVNLLLSAGPASQSTMSLTVPVGGPVEIQYDLDIGENYAVIGLRLYCKAAAGSRLQYRWFVNQTLLHDRGSFHSVVTQPPGQSMLLLSTGRGSIGTYRCEALNDFDNSSAISSKELLVSSKGTGDLPCLGGPDP